MKPYKIRKRRIWRNRTRAAAKAALARILTAVNEDRAALYIYVIRQNLSIALAMNLRISAEQFLVMATHFVEGYDLSTKLLILRGQNELV